MWTLMVLITLYSYYTAINIYFLHVEAENMFNFCLR